MRSLCLYLVYLILWYCFFSYCNAFELSGSLPRDVYILWRPIYRYKGMYVNYLQVEHTYNKKYIYRVSEVYIF